MILDDKIIMFPPPPPYYQSPPSPSSSSAHFSARPPPTLTSLPSHILLQIIHHTFPPLTSPVQLPVLPPSSPQHQHQQYQYLYEDTKPTLQRKTLLWLATSLRLVSRRLYTACMHVLRSTYLPSYSMLIRPPYTSDPFPLSLPSSSTTTTTTSASPQDPAPHSPTTPRIGPPAYTRSTVSLSSLAQQQHHDHSPLHTLHRETPILDRFIALKVRQDVLADDSELHIEREDAFRDLFDVAQPRARLEDLVRVEGVRAGVVCVPGMSGGGGGRQGQGQGQGVYAAGAGAGSSSSVVLLSSLKSQLQVSSSSASPPSPSPSSPMTSRAPKPKRSLFGFIKGSSSPSSPSSFSPSSVPPASSPHSPSHPHQQKEISISPLPFPALSVSFSPRRVGLVLNRSRTIAEVPRLGVGRNKEPLEVLARGLVRELRGWLEEEGGR